jgi:PPOX class probable F420-dependent enzyme
LTKIPESHQDLVSTAGRVGTLSTVGADGTPQVTALWYLLDGDVVRMSAVSSRQKTKNVLAHPQATMFFIDPSNPYRTLELRGTVSVEEDADLAFLGRLLGNYGTDLDSFPGEKEDRLVLTLTPTHETTYG